MIIGSLKPLLQIQYQMIRISRVRRHQQLETLFQSQSPVIANI
jgi:hypothetical protein